MRPRGDRPRAGAAGRFDRVDQVKEAVGQPVLPGDDRFWILGDPLVVETGDGERIVVPAGYTTDGALVPDRAERLTGWGQWGGPPADGRHRPRTRNVMHAAVVVGAGDAYRRS